MKQKFSSALSLALIMAMLFTSIGLASDVDVAVVDVTVPTSSVTLASGASGSITINMTISGAQAGTATFEVYRDWTLSGGVFSGSNPQEFTVGPRTGGAPPTIFSTSGTVTIDTNQSSGGPFILAVGVFDITNSNTTGAKLAAGDPSNYQVTVSPPLVQNQIINVTQAAPASATYGSTFNVAATGGGSGNPVVIAASGACSGSGNGFASITKTSGTGICTVTYNQAGSTGYNAAPQVTSSTTAQKADAAINVSGYAVTYDGNPHTATGIATGALGENLSGLLDLSGTTHTDAGTYNGDAWSFAGDGNHNPDNGTVNDSIGQAPITATAGGGSATYDGGMHAPSACVVSGAYTGDLTCENDPASVGPGADTYTIAPVVNGANLSNFAVTPVSGSFTIGKAATTTTVTCTSGPFTYDGAEHTPCSATVTGPNGLNQSLPVTYSNNVNAGTATASASYAESANYQGSSDSESFAIGKAATVTTVTCGSEPFSYSGSAIEPCTAAVTGAGGLNETLSVSYTDNVNAGVATASASYEENANYLGSSDSKNFTIDKATSTTTMTCESGPFTFDGSPHTPCSASYSTSDGESGSLTVDYSNNTNAGTATASASYAGDANHEASSDGETFTINKAATTTTVTCSAGPYTYNGSPVEPCTAAVTGAGGLNQSLSISYADNVNAGIATASASYAESGNYLASSDSENFTIDKAPSTTTVTCTANVTYTGSELEPCTAAATGAGGLNESLSISYADNVNAGTATASASYAGDANHLESSDSTSFTIDKAPSVTTVSCAAGSFVYNGSAFEPCTASVAGAGGLDESLVVSYANNVNAGTATASASYAGDANHLESSDTQTFTIDKADAECVVMGYNVYYDGNPHTATGSCTGVLGESLSGLDLSGTTHTTVGNYTDTWIFTDVTGNYNNATGTVNDNILAWRLPGFYQPVDMDKLNTVKGGSTVPLKFEVFAGSTELTNTAVVSTLVKQVTCNATAEDTIEVVATGGTSMRYDWTSGQFIFNWQTPKLPGKCYSVTLTTQDGTQIIALFKLK